MQHLKPLIALGIAFCASLSGPVLAVDPQQTAPAASIAALLKTDSGSGSTLDRLVAAIATQKAAEAAQAKASAAAEAAKAELAPAAENLEGFKASLEALPKDAGDDLRGALQRNVKSALKRVAPLETASGNADKAATTAKAVLEQAQCELEAAKTAWQADVMAPATAQVAEMAGNLAKLTAERDAAASAKAELAALRAKHDEFCARNPTVSLCLGQVSQTGG